MFGQVGPDHPVPHRARRLGDAVQETVLAHARVGLDDVRRSDPAGPVFLTTHDTVLAGPALWRNTETHTMPRPLGPFRSTQWVSRIHTKGRVRRCSVVCSWAPSTVRSAPARLVLQREFSVSVPPHQAGGVAYRFQNLPNWPPTPPGWKPPPGWRPDPAWGPAPHGWNFWVLAGPVHETFTEPVQASAPQYPQPAVQRVDTEIGVFGARVKARELAEKVNWLSDENTHLRQHLERLGVMEVDELEARRDSLEEEITGLEQEKERRRVRIESELRDSAKRAAQKLEDSKDTLEKKVAELQAEEKRERVRIHTDTNRLKARLSEVREQVVLSEDLAVLQEVGVYEYSHPLDDSVAYKSALADLKDRTRVMNRKDGGAVEATTPFTMNGSAAKGRAMVREFSKLLLRAYNNEADNLVRGMKPYKLSTSRERLTKSRATIEKLGRSMDIRISHTYHRLRLRELELTADHMNKVAEEREREREEKARLREERKAQAELDREKARLDKERRHYLNALAALQEKGDDKGARRLQEQIDDVGLAMEDVAQRAANVRAGYVYVISNLGSFGERMVKVGMTRRLDPMDRVRELSDASVPFNFDVHALHFSEDAVGVEAEMHRRLADKRVNRVNHRREFFFASPSEVRGLLGSVAGDLLQYEEVPEATEYRQSMTTTGEGA